MNIIHERHYRSAGRYHARRFLLPAGSRAPITRPIFNEVAKVDWTGAPSEDVFLLGYAAPGENSYSGNPMLPHLDLSRKATLDEEAFNAWKQLFSIKRSITYSPVLKPKKEGTRRQHRV